MKHLGVAFLSAALLTSAWGGATWAASSHSAASAPSYKIKGCTGKGNVSFMFWGDKGDKAAQHKSVALAEKSCPGLHVTEIWDQGNYDNDLKTRIGSGNAPDLFQLDGAKRIPEYASQGALASLDSFVKRDKINVKKVFWAQCLGEMSYKGHLYGLERSCGNQSILYYNKDMFKARGVKFPTNNWTYKDFLAAAKKLSGNYSVPTDPTVKLRFGYAWNNDDFRTEQYVWEWGGDWLTKNLHTCTLTSKASRAALQWWIDLRYKEHGAPTAEQMSSLPGYFDGFRNQNYAMTFMGAWALDYAFGKSPGSTITPPKFSWGAVITPKGPKNRQAVMAGTAEVISANSKNKNAAWWLDRFVTQGPGAVVMGSYGVDTPGAKALWKAPAVKKEYGSLLAVAAAANKTGRSPYLVPQYDKFNDTIQADLDPMWKNQASVTSATAKACADVKSKGLLP